MNQDAVKLGLGLILLALWTALIVFKVQGAEDLIGAVKTALVGLSAHYLTNFEAAASTPAAQAAPSEAPASPTLTRTSP